MRFHERHIRIVPAVDERGCPFEGPGVDLRGDAAAALLDDPRLVAPFRAWLARHVAASEQLRALSVDLRARRVLCTLDGEGANPRVVRLDPPDVEPLLADAEPLAARLAAEAETALLSRR